MNFNKVRGTPVGVDLSRTPPILAFHTIHGITVDADLSRTSPIYRPSVAFAISLFMC